MLNSMVLSALLLVFFSDVSSADAPSPSAQGHNGNLLLSRADRVLLEVERPSLQLTNARQDMLADILDDNVQLARTLRATKRVFEADVAKIDNVHQQLANRQISPSQASSSLASEYENASFLEDTLKNLKDRYSAWHQLAAANAQGRSRSTDHERVTKEISKFGQSIRLFERIVSQYQQKLQTIKQEASRQEQAERRAKANAAKQRRTSPIVIAFSETGQAYRNAKIEEKMDGSVSIDWGSISACSTDPSNETAFRMYADKKGIPRMPQFDASVYETDKSGMHPWDLENKCGVIVANSYDFQIWQDTNRIKNISLIDKIDRETWRSYYVEQNERIKNEKKRKIALNKQIIENEKIEKLQILEGISEGTRDGYGIILIKSRANKETICYLVENRKLILKLFQSNTELEEFSGYFIRINHNSLDKIYGAILRGSCRGVFGDAESLKRLTDSLKTKGIDFEVVNFWLTKPEYASLEQEIQRQEAQVAKEREEQAARFAKCTADPVCKAERDRERAAEHKACVEQVLRDHGIIVPPRDAYDFKHNREMFDFWRIDIVTKTQRNCGG